MRVSLSASIKGLLVLLLLLTVIPSVAFSDFSVPAPKEGEVAPPSCKPIIPSWIDNLGIGEDECRKNFDAAVSDAILHYLGCLIGAGTGLGGCGPAVAAQVMSCIAGCSSIGGALDPICLANCLSTGGAASSILACSPFLAGALESPHLAAIIAFNIAGCTVAKDIELCTAEKNYETCLNGLMPGVGLCPMEKPHCGDAGGYTNDSSGTSSSSGGFGNSEPQY